MIRPAAALRAPLPRPAPLALVAPSLAVLALAVGAHGARADERTATVVGHVLQPEPLEPTRERLDELALPEGFAISVFADGLVNPRMISVADDGTVYVTRREVGDVLMLRDEDGDGRAERVESVASRPMMHGIDVDGDDVWLTTVAEVLHARRRPDGTLGPLAPVVDDLPEGGQHPNRMVLEGPDGKLWVSVGSTCNACAETNPENATMLRMEPDGSGRTIFASGLRNTIGYAFGPDTGELYGMDHGIDWLGDNEQHEELNHLVQGAKYGWPYVYADGRENPADEPPGGITPAEWAAASREPVGLYTPHAAPMQMTFYTGDAFPGEYRGDAYVAMRGSWNRQPPSGYEVVRIDFEDGEPVGFEPFLSGFVTRTDDGWGQLGRLAGLAEGPDGALYLSDDENGVVYRIAYDPDAASPRAASGEAGAPAITNDEGADVRMLAGSTDEGIVARTPGLARELVAADAPTLELSSPAFADGEPIPKDFAAQGQNLSPPLRWEAGPEGTAAWVVLVEDPDAPVPAPPFVHWVAYDLPPDVTELREGVPGAPRLDVPAGALQGPNDRGSIGWFGPLPPVGDPAHRYHFQVFALDRTLDLPHGSTREEVLDAMRGHVLAAGELVGTYERPIGEG